MNKKLRKLYYDSRSGFQIIGCLLKKHELIDDSSYKLSAEDFYIDFHKGIYSAIYNLFQEGVEEITPIEIEAYLSRTSPRYYKIVFDDNDGFDWMEESLKHASVANFDTAYNRMRKLSYLRDQLLEGNSVADVYDREEISSAEIEKQTIAFDKMTLTDLKNHFGERNQRVNNKYESNSEGDYRKAGTDADKIMQRLRDGETYGLLGLSGYKNRVTYGNRRKKFHLMSGGTGAGKSRSALGEIAVSTAVELWDADRGEFVINPNNPHGDLSGIYIGTELELEMEVEIILWAVVSGLETSQIIELDLTDMELERLEYAQKVIERSKIHLYDRPNYGIATLKEIVKKHQMTEDVYIMGIDYILLTSTLVDEARQYSGGMWTREDQLFLFVSKSFKELANDFNIYVSSSTQLNQKMNDRTAEKNAGMIRGSFALCDKVDVGSLLLLIENQELEFVESILRDGFGNKIPTHVEHIFKNRGGKYAMVRIFKTMNLGNMQMEDLFCTDWEYNLLTEVEQIHPEPFAPIIECETESESLF